MPRKSSEAKSYLPTEGGGAAPAPSKRKRTTTRAKATVKAQPAEDATTSRTIFEEPQQPALAAPSSGTSLHPITEREEIACMAYLLWEARGGQGGSAEEDWLKAEQEVLKKRSATAC